MKFIFLVDDDLDEQHLFCAAVKSVAPKSTVTCCLGCEELLEKLTNAFPVPEIIFMDINMPRIKGHECLCRLYNNPVWQGIPVIIYSTSTETSDIELAFKNGAANYVTKTVSFAHLEKILEVVLSRNYKTHRRTRENFVVLQD